MKPTLAATAKIDLAALRHNLEQIKLKVPNSQITSIVKANGYGHGAVPVALALESLSDNFGVARIEEALELRRAGITSVDFIARRLLCRFRSPYLASQ